MPKRSSRFIIHLFYERMTLSLLRTLPSTTHPSSDSGHDALIGKEFVSDEVKRFLEDPRLGVPLPPRARVAREPVSHDQIVDAHRLSVETIERARRSSGAAIHLAQRDSNLAQIAPTSAEATHHGGASPFEMLMTRTPHIADRVHHIAREGQSHGHRASIADLHRLWLRDLRRDGVGDDEYPFTTRSCGRSAFSRWLRQIQGPEGEGRS